MFSDGSVLRGYKSPSLHLPGDFSQQSVVFWEMPNMGSCPCPLHVIGVYRVIWLFTAAQSFSPGAVYSQVRALFLPEVWEKAPDTAGVGWRDSISPIPSSADKWKPFCRVATSLRLFSALLGIYRVVLFAGCCCCHLMESVQYSFIWEFHNFFH